MSEDGAKKTHGDLIPVGESKPYSGQPPVSPEIEGLVKRLLEVKSEIDARKVFYDEYNRLVLELVRLGFTRAEMGGQVLLLKDNFASSNVGWTSAGVRRFEVEVISHQIDGKRKRRSK